MLSQLNLSLRTKQFLIALAIIFVWMCINTAFAESVVDIAPTGGINMLITRFTTALKAIQSSFQNGARNLFLGLTLIAIVWSYGQLLIKGGELNTVFFELVKTIMTVGFFWWLINDCADILFTIFKKFGEWGEGTGVSVKDASDIINKGTSICLKMLDVPSMGFNLAKFVSAIVGLVFSIFVFITCIFLAINMIILEIEFYFFCYIGIFVLGTAGSNWTRDSSIAYLKKLIAYSVQYFATLVMAGIAFSILTNYTNEVDALARAGQVQKMFLSMLTVLGVFLVITKTQQVIPQAMAGLFGGGGSGGYDAAGIGAKAALGATAAVGGAVLKAGGAGVGSGLANLAKGIGKGASYVAWNMATGSNSTANAIGSAALKAGATAKKAGHAMSAVSNATGLSASAKSLMKAFSPGK